jgi:hypothetical protein
LSLDNPLEKFKWDIPTNCPISIPEDQQSGFEKNIYLKEKFGYSKYSVVGLNFEN